MCSKVVGFYWEKSNKQEGYELCQEVINEIKKII